MLCGIRACSILFDKNGLVHDSTNLPPELKNQLYRVLSGSQESVAPAAGWNLLGGSVQPAGDAASGQPSSMRTASETVVPIPPQGTPYFTAEEAAAYLRTSVQGIYGKVKRQELKPLPGSKGKLLFEQDELDRSLKKPRSHCRRS